MMFDSRDYEAFERIYREMDQRNRELKVEALWYLDQALVWLREREWHPGWPFRVRML